MDAMAVDQATVRLSPINFEPLHERVYRELRRALMAGKFAPGERLKPNSLARDLGTSPMPVRAALSRLTAEYALAKGDGGSVQVPLISRTTFRDIMETRILIEGRAAAKACGHVGADGLVELKDLAHRLTAATAKDDIVAYLQLNQTLKFSIYQHCGSPTLRLLIESLWMRAGPFLRFLARDIPGLVKINHHDDAVAAIEANRPQRAEAAIQRDIREGMLFLLEVAEFARGEDQ
jgi:DNA-binding GntR family transcriptional regulator